MSDTERSDFLSRIERFFVSRLSVLCLSALGDKSYRLVKKNARQSFHPLLFFSSWNPVTANCSGHHHTWLLPVLKSMVRGKGVPPPFWGLH